MSDVKEVQKKGDYYVVSGRSGDREVSAHIPAPTVEGLSRKDAEGLFRRSVERVAEMGVDRAS